jgi:hypothetical protein
MEPKDQNIAVQSGTGVGRLTLMGLLVLLGIVVAFLMALWAARAFRESPPTEVKHPETGYTFPRLDAIASITVTIAGGQGDVREFEVSNGNWEKIISCLMPSEYDLHPKKWDSITPFRTMKITTKKGEVHCVTFFKTYKMIGAFAAGPSCDRQKDYLGGNSVDLEKALIAAYDESKR